MAEITACLISRGPRYDAAAALFEHSQHVVGYRKVAC